MTFGVKVSVNPEAASPARFASLGRCVISDRAGNNTELWRCDMRRGITWVLLAAIVGILAYANTLRATPSSGFMGTTLAMARFDEIAGDVDGVREWNAIAENTVVGSGAFQAEGFIYMGYVSAAVYDAVVSIEGGYEPYGPVIPAAPGASADAAAVEAAYRTLIYYFPGQAVTLESFYTEAPSLIPDGASKTAGLAVGLAAATNILSLRAGDGLRTP